MIQDSGDRTQFDSGAVRDIGTGKGRCDLMPLDIVGQLMHGRYPEVQCVWLDSIAKFIETHNTQFIRSVIISFSEVVFSSFTNAMLEVSVHYEEGAVKYGEHNWEKGIPAHSFLDSAVRHLFKFLRGDTDERHDRAFLWNLLGLLWTIEHHPELDDIGGSR